MVAPYGLKKYTTCLCQTQRLTLKILKLFLPTPLIRRLHRGGYNYQIPCWFAEKDIPGQTITIKTKSDFKTMFMLQI